MGKLIKGIYLTIIVSFFIFPAEFTFLPALFNTKNLLAAFGAVVFFYDSIVSREIRIPRYILFAGLLAVVFSLWCFFSITVNGTNDTTYVSYWSAFLLWVFAAYGVFFLLRLNYGDVDISLVFRYFAIVGVMQCSLALMIDNINPVKQFVDSLFVGGDYYTFNRRLYGIGCALDPAGCRFSVIQVMISAAIATRDRIQESSRSLTLYLLAFIIITVIGSMISRTTLVGSALGLAYIIFTVLRLRRGGVISSTQFRLFLIFGFLLIIAVIISIALYRTSSFFQRNFRFGFEAFFNWVESGEFRTDSTDTLLSVMWIWPTDAQTWLIGSGRYGVMEWGTDIGYCNFVLYSGLVGLFLFSVFFIYCHLSLIGKFNGFQITSLLLIALTFIIWTKVATDIFFIDALLFCLEPEGFCDSPQDET